MGDRQRTIIAFTAIIVILLIWSQLSRPKKKPEAEEPVKPDTAQVTTAKEEILPIKMPKTEETIVVDKKKIKLVLSTAGGSVKEYHLKEYDIDIVPQGEYLFITRFGKGENEVANFKYTIFDDSVVFIHRIENSTYRKVYH
jgi:YidC/Oxa1 family membrane protein insertase